MRFRILNKSEKVKVLSGGNDFAKLKFLVYSIKNIVHIDLLDSSQDIILNCSTYDHLKDVLIPRPIDKKRQSVDIISRVINDEVYLDDLDISIYNRFEDSASIVINGRSISVSESFYTRIRLSIDGECNVYSLEESIHSCVLYDLKKCLDYDLYEHILRKVSYLKCHSNGSIEMDIGYRESSYTITAYFDFSSMSVDTEITLRFDTLDECYCDDPMELSYSVNPEIVDGVPDTSICISSYLDMVKELELLGLSYSFSHSQSWCIWGWGDVVLKNADLNLDIFKKVVSVTQKHYDIIKKFST